MASPILRQKWPLIAASVAVVVALAIFWIWLTWTGLAFQVDASAVAGLLAPLVFASAVVERAVEILISPWRDQGATMRQKALTAAQAITNDAQRATAVEQASDALDAYRADTQQYAFAISMTLGMLTSIAGVRALQPFLKEHALDTLKTAQGAQYSFFLALDVSLSAALLAGGADGVHSVMSAVTSFFNASSDHSQQKSNQIQTGTTPAP
jgi:hypothetical protein